MQHLVIEKLFLEVFKESSFTHFFSAAPPKKKKKKKKVTFLSVSETSF